MNAPTLKTIATLQARAALVGAAVAQIDGDDGRPVYVLTDGPLTQQVGTLAALDAAIQSLEQHHIGEVCCG